MNKLGIAIGGLLMVGALAAPVTFAHLDTGNAPIGDQIPTITADLYKNSGAYNAPAANRVAGWYYTASSLIVGICDTFVPAPVGPRVGPQPTADGGPDCDPAPGGQPLPPEADDACPFMQDVDNPPNNADDEIAACEAATSSVGPGFTFTSISGVVADAEVGGLGTCYGSSDPVEIALDSTNGQNEVYVDGTPGQGSVEDGTWNDGGIGFVSHTDHYDCGTPGAGVGAALEDWNTLGCVYNPAVAEDAVSLRDVWLFTTCSWGTPVVTGGQGLDDVILQFVGNIPNCVLGGFYQSCIDNVQYLDNCSDLNQIDDAILQPTAGTPVCGDAETSIVCGAGAISTGSDNFGDGWGTAFLPAGDDDDDDTDYPDCNDFATATVFPLSGVLLEADSDGVPTGVFDVSVASVGYVA